MMNIRQIRYCLIFLLLLQGRNLAYAENSRSQKIVINEAVRSLLYLPLYHAKYKGFFKQNGLDVEIITAGTATSSFAAMISGQAHFSVADPMYVPIAKEKGADAIVVAQLVSRIAVWITTLNSKINSISKKDMSGKIISTHPRPMTAYTYSIKTITDLGLKANKDVIILESHPGTELIPLLNKRADFAITLEPQTSIAISKGAKVILSYPKLLGDQIFTGLMTRESLAKKQPQLINSVIIALQMALNDINSNHHEALKTAKTFFPQISTNILNSAINRMLTEKVIPLTTTVSEASWDKAMKVRLDSGDLKVKSSLSDNFYLPLLPKLQAKNKENSE